MSGFLFVQAEDGIRDLVRSRGLGDVYKRQVQGQHRVRAVAAAGARQDRAPLAGMADLPPVGGPVSYTHLTLPTSDLV